MKGARSRGLLSGRRKTETKDDCLKVAKRRGILWQLVTTVELERGDVVMDETCRKISVYCCIGSGIVTRTRSRLSERLTTLSEESRPG
jgi:hypothetical protein